MFSEPVNMSLYSVLAWFDEEFEPQALSLAVFTSLSSLLRVLSDIEAEEDETRFIRKRHARVGDASLAGFQFQSHVLQPFGKQFLTLLNNSVVLVQHHQIVGVSNHPRCIEHLRDLAGNRCARSSSIPCNATLANNGEIVPPCIVPLSVGNNSPSSSTPALSHALTCRRSFGLDTQNFCDDIFVALDRAKELMARKDELPEL